MIVLLLILFLSAVGATDAVYLIRKRAAMAAPVCPIGGNCEAVLESKYNKFFLIPNDVAGLLFYILVVLVAGLLTVNVGPAGLLKTGLKIIVGAGSLFSLILTFIQWRVIKSWCFWCLISALTTWLMAVVIFSKTF